MNIWTTVSSTSWSGREKNDPARQSLFSRGIPGKELRGRISSLYAKIAEEPGKEARFLFRSRYP